MRENPAHMFMRDHVMRDSVTPNNLMLSQSQDGGLNEETSTFSPIYEEPDDLKIPQNGKTMKTDEQTPAGVDNATYIEVVDDATGNDYVVK